MRPHVPVLYPPLGPLDEDVEVTIEEPESPSLNAPHDAEESAPSEESSPDKTRISPPYVRATPSEPKVLKSPHLSVQQTSFSTPAVLQGEPVPTESAISRLTVMMATLLNRTRAIEDRLSNVESLLVGLCNSQRELTVPKDRPIKEHILNKAPEVVTLTGSHSTGLTTPAAKGLKPPSFL